jgi:hypothetical protein
MIDIDRITIVVLLIAAANFYIREREHSEADQVGFWVTTALVIGMVALTLYHVALLLL